MVKMKPFDKLNFKPLNPKMNDNSNQYPNADDFLIEQENDAFNILRKNENGDFIKIGSLASPKYEPELDDRNQVRMRFEVQIDAHQPLSMNLIQYIPAEQFLALAERLRTLMDENISDS